MLRGFVNPIPDETNSPAFLLRRFGVGPVGELGGVQKTDVYCTDFPAINGWRGPEGFLRCSNGLAEPSGLPNL
jgi:hypothetical protein